MSTASGTIEVFRGNTWGPYTPTLQYSDGSPYVLPEGAVLLFTVKSLLDRSNDDAGALIKKDFSTGIWSLTEDDTDIPEATYRYDLKVVAPGVEMNSATGSFIIKQRVGVRDE